LTLEIKVGPPQLTVHQGYTVMVSEPDGQIPEVSQNGLFFLDTRLICVWTVFADGVPWKLLNGGGLTGNSGRVFCTNPEIPTSSGKIAENTLGLAFGRRIDGGMHEDIEITNHGSEAVCFNLELVIRSDFADIFEVKSKSVTRRGDIAVAWSSKMQTLTTTYTNEDFSRAIRLRADDAGSPMTYANGRLSFNIELPPGGAWRASLLYDFADGETWSDAPDECITDCRPCLHARREAMERRCGQGRDQQRHFRHRLFPGRRRHVRPAAAARGDGSYPVCPGRWTALVRGAVWPRQPDYFPAERHRSSAVRAGGAEDPCPMAGDGAR
jgi:hypothetical protein